MDAQLSMLQEAEDNYYITTKYVLELASRAYELFKSSEVEERRQLIKLVLSNLSVEGKNLVFQAKKPFDTIINYADRKLWLPRVDFLHFIQDKLTSQCDKIFYVGGLLAFG